MQGTNFKKTMIDGIERLKGDETRGVTSFYKGAITALLNCGVMTLEEFWKFNKILTEVEMKRKSQRKKIDKKH